MTSPCIGGDKRPTPIEKQGTCFAVGVLLNKVGVEAEVKHFDKGLAKDCILWEMITDD